MFRLLSETLDNETRGRHSLRAYCEETVVQDNG